MNDRFGGGNGRGGPRGITRRQTLRATVGAGALLAAGGRRAPAAAAQTPAATPGAIPAQPGTLSAETLHAFDADVKTAMETFGVAGAAVAIVRGAEVVHHAGFGARDLRSGAPVTDRTRFRVGSVTKSMTALMAAAFVDEGTLAWDAPAVNVWPQFRAPDADLTRGLRLRDLFGMASGLAESPTVEFFMSAGTESALDVLRAIAYLPVIAAPGEVFSYNNTLYCAGGYLPALAQKTEPGALEATYADQMRRRVFEPVSMTDAAIAADPRPLGEDNATGYTRDLLGQPTAVPYVSIDGAAPAGMAFASAADLARYLIVQMNGGVTPEGVRVVSAANLAETHRPGIEIAPGQALPAEMQPDTVSMHYGMGWVVETFADGRRLIHHNGGIDGFATLVGFFPADRIGFVVLTNLEPGRGGAAFNRAVRGALLGRLFGLERDTPARLAEAFAARKQRTAALAARTRPVDPAAVAPFLGWYSDGFRLRFGPNDELLLEHDIRSMPLLALPNGNYVVADGPDAALEKTVVFAAGPGGPTMTIEGFDPARWLTGD